VLQATVWCVYDGGYWEVSGRLQDFDDKRKRTEGFCAYSVHRKCDTIKPVKHSAEFQAFDSLVGRVLAVSHEEIQKREAEYRKQVEANPRKRGPKRKIKPSASDPASSAPSR
jgi:hypothetical protein